MVKYVGLGCDKSLVTNSHTTWDSSEPCGALRHHLFFLEKLELLVVTGDEYSHVLYQTCLFLLVVNGTMDKCFAMVE